MTRSTGRGSVIIPAHNEASVITRSLTALGPPAAAGQLEVIVVCNGCSDATAGLARSIDGIRVIEVDRPSKIHALNVGDEVATLWPRMYLDADISADVSTVVDVMDRLQVGDILAARPPAHFSTDGASAVVRSYYRARARMPELHTALWGAGSYAMTKSGHERFGQFPPVIGDDLFVDLQFHAHEKVIVPTDPVVVRTPRRAKDLLAILRRAHRGNAEGRNAECSDANSARRTAQLLPRTIRGSQSLIDAMVYAGFALHARVPRRRDTNPTNWERDNSTRP